jgi:hypothetical protein
VYNGHMLASLCVPGVFVVLGAIWLANLWLAEPHYRLGDFLRRR